MKGVDVVKKRMTTNRLTFDLSESNKHALEQFKERDTRPFGAIVNYIINTVCMPSEEVRNQIISDIKHQIRVLNKQCEEVELFEKMKMIKQIEEYLKFIQILNCGLNIKVEDIINTVEMVKYDISNGYVVYPEDWILVNPEDAAMATYVGVVEVRQKELHIPHFLFFSSKKINQLDSSFFEKINTKCAELYPKFHDVLKMQVPYIEGVNEDEFLKSPQIGHFQIPVQGEDDYFKDHKPPYGAMVIRK